MRGCGDSSGRSWKICYVARRRDNLADRVRSALEDPEPTEPPVTPASTPLEHLHQLGCNAQSESVRVQALKVLLEREDQQAQRAQTQRHEPEGCCAQCGRPRQLRPEPSEEQRQRDAAEVALILAEAGALAAVVEGRAPSGSALE
jgi:hypothetical protein